ncbi:hypothetical protein [Kordia sp.]|uniref:hypothetical protein n=1 Tax=Kordia sp. TaxID=1965332 RepID=UPI003B5B19F0
MALTPIDNYNEIAIEKAALETEAWQKVNNLKAFLFHQNDINCLLQNPKAVGVRFYMGLEVEENEDGTNAYIPDMMIVGANNSGDDLVSEKGPSGVYNFALPCPRACAIKSPLLHDDISDTTTMNLCNESSKTITFSTEDECKILENSISLATAIERTERWQTYNVLRSILLGKEDLAAIFTEYNVTSLRVYFAYSENGLHRIILIGATEAVDENGNSYYEDVEREFLYTNDLAPCTMTHTETCASGSPLCHGCS